MNGLDEAYIFFKWYSTIAFIIYLLYLAYLSCKYSDYDIDDEDE